MNKSILHLFIEIAACGRMFECYFSKELTLRENLMLTLDQKKNKLVFLAGEEATFSGNFHPFVNQKNIYALYDEYNLVYSHNEANGNAKIIFLDLTLKVTKLIR